MPPRPAPKNTSTREYYFTDDTTDSPPDDNIDYPSSSPSPSPTHTPPKNTTDSSIEVQQEPTPSPTPSDIVTAAALDDVVAMGEYNKDMIKKGVSEKERKEKLLALQEKLVAEREKEIKKKAGEDEDEDDG
jgi:hypothetical protein